MKALALIIAIFALTACATPQSPAQQQPAQQQPSTGPDTEMATRISRICALPPGERDKEIEKLKKDSGMVLYCGKRD